MEAAMGDYWKDNNIKKPQQVVVCAACKRGETIIAGARHFDKVMVSQIKAIEGKLIPGGGSNWEEGFIDQFGDFLTREEAMGIAIAGGQKVDIEYGCGGDHTTLYSEGLY
jgi:hypothetical protein